VRALPGFLKLQAGTVYMQLMMMNFLAQDIPGILQDGVKSGITKFLDTSAIGAEQMIGLATTVAFLVVGSEPTKLMVINQAAFKQQIQGIVHGRPGHPQSQCA
jgi:hypothetical protein